MTLPAPRHFLMRLVRGGPLVCARLRWLDHALEDPPENKLDRGRLSVFPVVDVAGEIVEPEVLFDRLYSSTDTRSAIAPGHWKFCQEISEAAYRGLFRKMRDAEAQRQADPVLRPRRRIDPRQIALPDFSRENAR